jgi:PhzF family phenazine biosynthesis protein
MNLSETAFLLPGRDAWNLRWFTPASEVDLCGHATLAAAHALWETGRLRADESACFATKSGLLTCRADGRLIEMDFPSQPPRALDPPPGMLEALGVEARFVGGNTRDWLVELESEAAVRSVSPDFGALVQIPSPGDQGAGFIVTAPAAAGGEIDVVSRFFAPKYGIDEDPVTGSAHCCLGPFWAQRLGKATLRAAQLSERGGLIELEVRGDRVLLRGQAVTVIRGRLSA